MTEKIVGDNGTRLAKEAGRRSSRAIWKARRSLLWSAALVPVLVACALGSTSFARDRAGADSLYRGRKIPVGGLYLDAHNNKCGVKIYNDNGKEIGGASLLNLRNAKMYSFLGGERGLPASIRATWSTCQRTPNDAFTGIGGTLIGDYTAPVAERIPAEVIDYLRTKGGSLRLKIRLVDNGVLIGWDVEKIIPAEGWKPGDGPSGVHYYMAGGDFREDQVFNGKVIEPGWEHTPRSIDNLAQGNQSR